MTFKKLAFYSFLQWVILAGLKLWFFNFNIFSNPGLQQIVYWAIIIIVAAALVRRFGVVNFFESFFIILAWVLTELALDFFITGHFTAVSMFSTQEYWVGIALLAVSVFLFHKKRHIHVRHELHAKAHAVAHAPVHGENKPH